LQFTNRIPNAPMRRYFLLFSVLIISLNTFCSLPISLSNGGNSCNSYAINPAENSIDYLAIFNGINNNSLLNFAGSGTSINWYKYSDQINPIATNQTSISPEDSTGYILNVDGVKTLIWVVDYSKKIPTINSITATNGTNQCKDVNLKISGNIPSINYYSPTNSKYTYTRNFTATYKNGVWDKTSKTWNFNQDTTINIAIMDTTRNFTVKAPIYNASSMNFKITGDQFNSDLGIQPANAMSNNYTPTAVACHITTETNVRTQKNEGQRPTSKDSLSGSAPIDVLFSSNSNDPIAKFYNWKIIKDGQVILTRADNEHRYSFTQTGTYQVKLTVSNETCSASDSVLNIVISTSSIYVPRVFTPNGDGVNDEFRVGYTSLSSYECWVFNRWGIQVYHGTDPERGWDGTINGGAPAAPSAYYYVIKATGADGIQYNRTGDVNLLR
jgi:gliding motility-associated-like protein